VTPECLLFVHRIPAEACVAAVVDAVVAAYIVVAVPAVAVVYIVAAYIAVVASVAVAAFVAAAADSVVGIRMAVLRPWSYEACVSTTPGRG